MSLINRDPKPKAFHVIRRRFDGSLRHRIVRAMNPLAALQRHVTDEPIAVWWTTSHRIASPNWKPVPEYVLALMSAVPPAATYNGWEAKP